jgi:DNA polymerase III alpha subunit
VCESKLAKYSGQELEKRIKRVETELKEYERRNLFDILRVLIFVIDEFKKQNIVWGVGRGSSCASYILFLIEVHSVDPVKYSIPLAEFFK